MGSAASTSALKFWFAHSLLSEWMQAVYLTLLWVFPSLKWRSKKDLHHHITVRIRWKKAPKKQQKLWVKSATDQTCSHVATTLLQPTGNWGGWWRRHTSPRDPYVKAEEVGGRVWVGRMVRRSSGDQHSGQRSWGPLCYHHAPAYPQTVEQEPRLSRLGGLDFPDGPVVKNPPAKKGTWVWYLVQEDSTCCRATKPMLHSYWACATTAEAHEPWSPYSATREPTAMGSLHTTTRDSPHSPQLEKGPRAATKSPCTTANTQHGQR